MAPFNPPDGFNIPSEIMWSYRYQDNSWEFRFTKYGTSMTITNEVMVSMTQADLMHLFDKYIAMQEESFSPEDVVLSGPISTPGTPGGSDFVDYAKLLPGMELRVMHPERECRAKPLGVPPFPRVYSRPLFDMIIHLNDVDHWTRDEIADWLETLDDLPAFASPDSVDAEGASPKA